MPKVTYVATDGKITALDVPAGTSVMKAAVLHGVDGIVGECGGNLMCATCHVYVDRELELRHHGYEGDITLIGEESEEPYDGPRCPRTS